MFSKALKARRDELKNRLVGGGALQQGLTLVELLVVIVILGVLAAVLIVAFSSAFGKLDGSELQGESRDIERAVIQTALNSDNRDTPALTISGDVGHTAGTPKSIVRTDKDSVLDTLNSLPDGAFNTEKDASVVLKSVAERNGLTEASLRALLRPVDGAKIKNKLSTNANPSDYYVVVRKYQLYDTSATAVSTAFKDYNDELANVVFTKDTVVEDGNYYNGTKKVKP